MFQFFKKVFSPAHAPLEYSVVPHTFFQNPEIAKAINDVGYCIVDFIEEEKIPVDIIVGSSVGSVMASLWATGRTAKELSDYQQAVETKANPVKAAKAKVAKLAKVKVAKATKAKAKPVARDEDEVEITGSRLNRIIAESEPIDQDVEDFNAILRENGIEV